LHYRNQ